MGIPFLVEKAEKGYRAVAGGPFDLTAEATSADDAVAALTSKIQERLNSGAILIEQTITSSTGSMPVMPLLQNPLFDEWLTQVEAFRQEREAEELAAEIDGL